jgi:hypothetical protein
MDAKELRKKLDEGLKPDSGGKTTPIQRLTPFLIALCDYLDQVSSDDATEAGTSVQAKPEQSVGASKPAA